MDRFGYFWSLMIVAATLFLVGVYRNVVVKIAYIRWDEKGAPLDKQVVRMPDGRQLIYYGFASAPPDALREGVQTLARVLRAEQR